MQVLKLHCLTKEFDVSNLIPITVATGDGIGPEIMGATLGVLRAVGAPLAPEFIEIGERVYRRGATSGIEPAAWESIRRTKVLLKAPITTPQGSGVKSLNVTLRKTLGLFANVRPCISYSPHVVTRHPGMDIVIIRENEEDLYAGIEHRQTQEVVQCLKLISEPGSERIVRYAFEFARNNGRRKVSCFTKDNIMKMTDGLFHRVFERVAQEYPEIKHEHLIVDIGAARIADTSESFDVVVLPNLYGDIISDVAAQITGSVGLAGSANIGQHGAMFEAIHGSAPDIAGRDCANPSGLLLSSVMMLVHLGLPEIAETVHNAWLRTIEDGVHTPDFTTQGGEGVTVGTVAFGEAVVSRLGQKPRLLTPATYRHGSAASVPEWKSPPKSVKKMVGVDVFFDYPVANPASLAAVVEPLSTDALSLSMITNRGVKVWPDGFPETACTDHWRCRFNAPDGTVVHHAQIVELLSRADAAGLDFIKFESLCTFDDEPGFSLGQGQ